MAILGENYHNTSPLDDNIITVYGQEKGSLIPDVAEIKRSRYASVSHSEFAIWIAVRNRREPSNFANVSVTTRS